MTSPQSKFLFVDKAFQQWTRSKGYDTFTPIGPCINTEIDPAPLNVLAIQGDETRQNYPVSDMIYSPQQIVSMISEYQTLMPGDLICCGTSVGARTMKPGSEIEVSIPGIGSLINPFDDIRLLASRPRSAAYQIRLLMALAIGNNQQRFTFRMIGAARRADRIRITAEWVSEQFEQFYREFLEVPYQAKAAFEQQHHGTSIWLSRHRLSLYSDYIHRMGAYLKAIQPNISFDVEFLNELEALFWRMVEDRYEADVAYAFMHSIRRMVYRDEWKPVEYTFWESADSVQKFPVELLRHYDVEGEIEPR